MTGTDRGPESVIELLQQLKQEGVSPDLYHARISRFLGLKAREMGVPYAGSFELTPLCNLDCRMCYVHLSGSQLQGNTLLSVEQWKDLMHQAKEAGMREATLTGGECMTYPGFDEVYLFLQEMGVEVTVYTNGILLDADRVRFFQKHPPAQIQLTLYGSSEEAYERVTGRRAFKLVMDHLRLADEAGLPLKIALTPSRFMESDAEGLSLLAQSTGLRYTINACIFEPRENTGRSGQSLDASLETYIKMYRMKRIFNKEEIVPMKECDLPLPNSTGEPRKGLRCAAGRGMFEINWQGRMFACTNLVSISADPFKDTFKNSWESIHRQALDYMIPAECGGCAYAPSCVVCPAAHEKDGSAEHCNPVYCERIRRLAMEGIARID